MDAHLLLCDAAEVVGNRVFVLGGGWTGCSARIPGMAVVVLLDVPWDQANRRHDMDLALLDEDGNPVSAGNPPREVRVQGSFEVGRPAGHPAGMPLRFMQAVNFHRLPLEPARRYGWELRLNGEPTARVSFFTLRDK